MMNKILSSLLVAAFAATTAHAGVLYNNGADAGENSWQVNFGHSVTNSFVLGTAAQVEQINLSIWDVDDLNDPISAAWKITTQPFGGEVVASGNTFLGLVEPCQQNREMFCVW